MTTLSPQRRSEDLTLAGVPLRRWVDGVFAPVDVLGDATGRVLARVDSHGHGHVTIWSDGEGHALAQHPGDDRRWVLHRHGWTYGVADLVPASTGWRRWTGATDAVVVDMPPLSSTAQLLVLVVLVRRVVHRETVPSM